MSGALGRNCFDKRDEELGHRDEELKCLHRLVRDLELEARGRRWRWDHEEQGEGLASVGGHRGVGSHQSGSHRHQDLSREYADRDSISLKERRPQNAAMDAVSHYIQMMSLHTYNDALMCKIFP